MWHLDSDETLQLVIVGEIDQAETALAEQALDPVATDVRGGGCPRNGLAGLPSGFVHGLLRIVHG
jgi:hypothetical protein